MARCTGLPVRRSQTSVVSRWLVMPIAATSPAAASAMASACRAVASVVRHRSSGSCSTQPDAGKCCENSSCAEARIRCSRSNKIDRVDVVPWSMARTRPFMLSEPGQEHGRERPGHALLRESGTAYWFSVQRFTSSS
jgi:hypothetical protein